MSEKPSVVVLAGGTGGAKLARGMLDLAGELTVVANTGDDVEIHGVHVSPDPDLISFWLADAIDRRGWGLDGDSFALMDGLRALGQDVWFNLGDRDLAVARRRTELLRAGRRLTDAHRVAIAAIATGAGCSASVLPMSDRPVRTRVLAAGRWWTLQEFLIRGGGRGPVRDVQFRGARSAGTTPEVLDAIARAEVIAIGPSNPVLSIGPMLAIPELAAALRAARAPVIAVSPIVGGAVLKGPTAACLRWLGQPVSGAGVAAAYAGLIDGLLADDPPEPAGTPEPAADPPESAPDAEPAADAAGSMPVRSTELLMSTPAQRTQLAAETLSFADELAGRR